MPQGPLLLAVALQAHHQHTGTVRIFFGSRAVVTEIPEPTLTLHATTHFLVCSDTPWTLHSRQHDKVVRAGELPLRMEGEL